MSTNETTETTENMNMNIEPTTNVKPTTKEVSLTLLTNLKAIIDISTSRGTYKANELSTVGKVYDELVLLLQ
tara:strand:- start:331 stop:546 length:216 start_codon:yes stop_codon:yes gene_type:complete